MNWQSARASLAETLSDILAFARRPRVDAADMSSFRDSAIAAFWLLALSFAATAAFGLVALPIFLLTDTEPTGQIDMPGDSPFAMLVAVVLLGPLVEELMFRGWLSGRFRAIVITLFSLGLTVLGADLLRTWWPGLGDFTGAMVFAFAALIVTLLSSLDRGPTIAFYGRLFPFLFWLQSIVFGALHYNNYAGFPPVVAAIATIPLILCGIIWGFARIRLGFGWAVILHMLYNAVPAVAFIVAMHSTL